MAIYLRCCDKFYKINKRKCDVCDKNLSKYVVKVQDPVTRRWRTKTVMNNLKLAKDVEAKFKTDLVEGNIFNKKKVGTIEFSKYLAYAKNNKKTWKVDQCRWNLHVKDHDYMTKQGIMKIMSRMKNEGYAPCTIHHVLKLIKRIYNWSIENEYYFGVNPCNSIKAPRYDNRVMDFMSKDEIDYLLSELDKWDNEWATRVVKFALYSGRRKGEITNLTWDSVDLDNKTITCKNTKNGKHLSFPLNEQAYNVILEAKNNKICEYVFPSSTGQYYYHGFSLGWKRFKKRINLKYRFHDLRHTFASHLASSGVQLHLIQKLLGHQDYALCQRYAHLTDEAIKEAVCVMDGLF